MGIFNTFKTDMQAEKEGVWKEFDANKDGTKPAFLLRRMGPTNPEFQKHIERFSKTYKTELNLDILTEEQAKGPMLDAFVETVLVGWRNIQREDGTAIEYSKENAKALMLELPDLYIVLREMAAKLSTFRDIEVTAGN